MTKRVWFNHWFSSVVYIFDYIIQRNNSRVFKYSEYSWSDFCIYATNNAKSPLIAHYADYWELEPVCDDEIEYIAWCLEFVERHEIDLFIPRIHKDWVSKHIEKFYSIGCMVDYQVENMFTGKNEMYELLKKEGFDRLIPTYRMVDSRDSFYDALYDLGERNICMKKDIDEGGKSFIKLRDRHLEGMYSYLTGDLGQDRYIDTELAARLFEESAAKKQQDKFLIMPYLTQEISCDCMKYGTEFICITREKSMNHIEKVRLDMKLKKICEELYEKLLINGIVNVQFRYENNILKVIDINYRMSGGIHKSCEASCVNLPLLLVDSYIGKENLEVRYDPVFVTGKNRFI